MGVLHENGTNLVGRAKLRRFCPAAPRETPRFAVRSRHGATQGRNRLEGRHRAFRESLTLLGTLNRPMAAEYEAGTPAIAILSGDAE